MIPTYKRPDLLRRAVLQWIVQTRKPDLLCIHQNNSTESYEWVIEDLKPLINIKWLHSPDHCPQHFWYLVPLSYLLKDGCDVFLWGDHDDIYFTNHVENSLKNLEGSDIALNDTCGVLFLKDKDYKMKPPEKFTAHAAALTISLTARASVAATLGMSIIWFSASNATSKLQY